MKRASTIVCVVMLLGATLARASNDQKSSPSSSQSALQTCTLKVSGMTCASCDVAVRIAAKTLKAVKTVKVDYSKGRAEVSYDPAATNPKEIADVITVVSGFKTEPIQKPAKK
jgi:copper chaperone CopZ